MAPEGGGWTVLKRWAAEGDGVTEVVLPVQTDAPVGFYRLAISGGE